MQTGGPFDGFMPMITDVIISGKTASITSDGQLVDGHLVNWQPAVVGQLVTAGPIVVVG